MTSTTSSSLAGRCTEWRKELRHMCPRLVLMQFCEVPLPTENGMRYCMKYGRICEDEYALVRE